ncbi:MAG: M48 family metalloprotease [Pseudoruegeria sp.]
MTRLKTLSAVCLSVGWVLSACTVQSSYPQQSTPAAAPQQTQTSGSVNFKSVVRRVEAVAESECQQRTSGVNCDFLISVDERENQPPNAYQTLNKSGRPVLVFTKPLIADVQNADELAFIMGHEAAHHIAAHLAKTQDNAFAGALVAGILASQLGGNASAIEAAQQIGATVGSRTYSKEYELEADALGTVIAHRSGFDPVKGAKYFTRIPDPGNAFLGTHPPNAARVQVVQTTAANLRR